MTDALARLTSALEGRYHLERELGAGSWAQQIIMKIIAEPVAAVTSLRKSVPPNVAAALMKALEKGRRRRRHVRPPPRDRAG
jgi:hypothetical protein